MIVIGLTGTDGIVMLPGVVDSNSFIKLSFPFCVSDILHTYVFLYSTTEYTLKYKHINASSITTSTPTTKQTIPILNNYPSYPTVSTTDQKHQRDENGSEHSC
jgi:hypothetical protein